LLKNISIAYYKHENLFSFASTWLPLLGPARLFGIALLAATLALRLPTGWGSYTSSFD
jgi:hypothetical protein